MTATTSLMRIGQRELGRATLERQWLLRRHDATVPNALEHLIGVQAQANIPPYVAMWARLIQFSPLDLDNLARKKKIVRCALMRSTIHLTTAADALKLRPLLQASLERALVAAHGKRLVDLDLAAVSSAARAILKDGALTYRDLGNRLQEKWPNYSADLLANVVRTFEPLVQAPPVGWGGGTRVRMAPLSEWLGLPRNEDLTSEALISRYLAAYGPTTAADIRIWSGLSNIAQQIKVMRPSLMVYRNEIGAEVFDLPDAPRPHADTIAPARLIGGFDGIILGFADRSRFLDEAHRHRIVTKNGLFHPLLLIDGRVAGTWSLSTTGDSVTAEISPFAKLSVDDEEALANEAFALIRSLPETKAGDVRFLPVK